MLKVIAFVLRRFGNVKLNLLHDISSAASTGTPSIYLSISEMEDG